MTHRCKKVTDPVDKIIAGEIPGLVLQTHPYTKGLFYISVVQLLFFNGV